MFIDVSKHPALLKTTAGRFFATKCCGTVIRTNGLVWESLTCPSCGGSLWVCDFCGYHSEGCDCERPHPRNSVCSKFNIHGILIPRPDCFEAEVGLPSLEES